MEGPAEKLPVEVAEELKWFVWNDIWARVNSRLASQEEGKRRQERHKQARQDGDRSDAHFRKAVALNAFPKTTLHAFRRQVAAIGSAAATGAQEGNTQKVKQATVLDCPKEIDEGLWEKLVEAIKNAAVAANMMSLGQDKEHVKPVQDKFEEAWRQFEQDVGSYYDEDAAEDPEAAGSGAEEERQRAGLPASLVAELKWFAWNRIWSRVNADLACQREGDESQWRMQQSQKDGRRAEAHFEAAAQQGSFGEEAMRQYRRQVEALGTIAIESLKDGNWLRATQAQALPPPDGVEAELWIEIVRAVKCASVASHMMSREENLNMAFQAEFDEAWGQLELN